MNEDLFWDIVQSAPLVEADDMLRRRRRDALARRLASRIRGDGIEEERCNLLLHRLNDELHRLSRVNRDYQMQLAIRHHFGDEGWEKVKLWLIEKVPQA